MTIEAVIARVLIHYSEHSPNRSSIQKKSENNTQTKNRPKSSNRISAEELWMIRK